MAQINYELIQKLPQAVAVLEERSIPTLTTAADAIKEVAVSINAGNLIKDAEALEGAIPSMVSVIKAIAESLEEATAMYKKSQEVLG